MNPEHADAAVLAAAILTLVAITAKLVTSNLVSRAKKNWGKIDYARREIVGRLRKAQLASTSAKGTLEFWERRRSEATQRLMDMERDLEAYAEQFADEDDGEEGEESSSEGTQTVAAGDDTGDGDVEVAEDLSREEDDDDEAEAEAVESAGEDENVVDSGDAEQVAESVAAESEPATAPEGEEASEEGSAGVS